MGFIRKRRSSFLVLSFTLPLLWGCYSPQEKERDPNETRFYEADHDYVIHGASLDKRMTTMANNMPTKEEIENMRCDSIVPEAFWINGNSMKFYTFDPAFLARFADDPKDKYLGEPLDPVTKDWKTNESYNWELDQLPHLLHFDRWDSVIYSGPNPWDPSKSTDGNHGMLSQISQVEESFKMDANFGIVYKHAIIRASASDTESFDMGMAKATIVVFDKVYEPVCAYDVTVMNDQEIEYTYYEGEDQQEAVNRAIQADLEVNFHIQLEIDLANRIKGMAGKYKPGYGKFRVEHR